MGPSFSRSGCVNRSALERVCSALERVCFLAISTSAKGWWGDKKGLCRIRHVAASCLKVVGDAVIRRHACVPVIPPAQRCLPPPSKSRTLQRKPPNTFSNKPREERG